jgi:hypothetical protein
MSFSKLSLPSTIIVDLFRHSLVKAGFGEEISTVDTERNQLYRFLGGNLKKANLIISSSDSFSIPEKHLSFLVKILEACKMTLADVAILNHASQNIEIDELKEQLQPRTIILFGIEPKQINLPFNSPAFKIQEYDGCNFLYAPSMEELNQDTENGKLLKSKLWVCLRKIFEV